jgi:pimeloyl-ACP methyl ester carboxylesterase
VHDLGGSGSPLLLCHATGFHGRVWQPVADALTSHHAYAPDLRGHGDSAVPPDLAIDWHGFGDDVLAVVDELASAGVLDPHAVVAAGHSKGGAALLLAEQARPGTFRALYCFEPIVFPSTMALPSSGNPLAEGARRRRASFDSYDAAYDNFASKPPLNVLHPDALWAYVRYGFAEQPDGSVVLKCRPETEAATFEMGSQHGGYDRLDAVRCPVTIARGAVEASGPASFAPAIAEALPNAVLEEHPELGHFGPLEAPETIAAALERALA